MFQIRELMLGELVWLFTAIQPISGQCVVFFNLHSNPYPFFMTWHFQIPFGLFGLLEISMKGCFPIRKRVREQTQALYMLLLPARAPCGKGHSS